MLEFIRDLSSRNVDIIFTALAAIATLLSVLAALWKALQLPRIRHRYGSAALEDKALQPAHERLEELQQELAHQRTIVRTNRWMSGFLTIGQYIIGGLLASSFVQQSLSQHIVGVLGLLVLLSSLIYQHFRPDIQLRGAIEHLAKLRSTIREAEDDLYAMQTNPQKALSIEDFRRKIPSVLLAIEAYEQQDLMTRTSGQVQTTNQNNKPTNSRKDAQSSIIGSVDRTEIEYTIVFQIALNIEPGQYRRMEA